MSAITELKGHMWKAVGNSETRAIDSVDPSLVVGHEAAIYARDISTSQKENLNFMSRVGVSEGHNGL